MGRRTLLRGHRVAVRGAPESPSSRPRSGAGASPTQAIGGGPRRVPRPVGTTAGATARTTPVARRMIGRRAAPRGPPTHGRLHGVDRLGRPHRQATGGGPRGRATGRSAPWGSARGVGKEPAQSAPRGPRRALRASADTGVTRPQGRGHRRAPMRGHRVRRPMTGAQGPARSHHPGTSSLVGLNPREPLLGDWSPKLCEGQAGMPIRTGMPAPFNDSPSRRLGPYQSVLRWRRSER